MRPFEDPSPAPLPARLALIALISLAVCVFLGKSYDHTLQAMDSSVYARLALDSTRYGGWPHLPIGNLAKGEGHWSGGFNDHPFTLIWLSGWVMRALGPSALSARLLASSFSVGAILIVYLLGVRLYRSRAVGIAAGGMTLLTPLMMTYGSRFQLDPAMIFGILLASLGWVSGNFGLTWAGTVIGVWMKGPLGFLPFAAAFLTNTVTRSWRKESASRFAIAAGGGLLLGGLIWAFIAALGSPALVRDYWLRFVFGQIAERANVPAGPILMKIFLRWLPGTAGLIAALILYFKRRRFADPALTFPLSAAFSVAALVSLMRMKYEHYYLPAFPFLALFIAGSFRDWIERRAARLYVGVISAGLIIPAALLAFPIDVGVEKFPALRKFMARIGTRGSCHDTILYVEGGLPYGGHGDYAAIAQFYVNRHVEKFDCAQDPLPPTAAWLMYSEKTSAGCETPRLKAAFPHQLTYGSQFLRSRYPLIEDGSDLAWLETELRGVADCEIPAPPPSRYFSTSTTH